MVKRLLQRSPIQTASDWADANRILPPGSAEPGQWRSVRTPYMIPVSEACRDPKYRRVIVVMGSQMGKTAGLLNVIGQRLDDDPAPIIYVAPTKNNIDNVIEPKLMELFKSVPSLWAKLSKGKSMSKTHKRIAGVSLRLAWAGSPTELASDHAVLVLVDEVDRMTDNVKSEGHVFELAEARTSTYVDGKAIGTSTPTLGTVETFIHPQTGIEHWTVSDLIESKIWRLWQEGSRHEWAWQCPHCQQYFIPRLKYLTWPKDATPEQARKQARLVCPKCGGLIEDSQKLALNATGKFIGPGQFVNEDGEIEGIADTQNDTASFWVSGICSFSPKKSFGFLAQKWLCAVNSQEPERIQSVLNTDFGELFSQGGEAPKWTEVADRKQAYPQGQVPQGVNLLTAGVDVQKNRLVYVIRGWGKAYESWLIEQGELWGDTDKPFVWQQLSELIQRSIADRPLSKVAIDTGYQTLMVYQFCRQHPVLTLATKGHDRLDKPFYRSTVDVNGRGQTLKKGLSLWHFHTDQMKSWIHARISWPIDQPGGWWLPEDVSEDYCQQIVSEQRIVKPDGKVIWIQVKKDNHYLDAESLAYLGARIIVSSYPLVLEQGWSGCYARKQRRVISQGIMPGFTSREVERYWMEQQSLGEKRRFRVLGDEQPIGKHRRVISRGVC